MIQSNSRQYFTIECNFCHAKHTLEEVLGSNIYDVRKRLNCFVVETEYKTPYDTMTITIGCPDCKAIETFSLI